MDTQTAFDGIRTQIADSPYWAPVSLDKLSSNCSVPLDLQPLLKDCAILKHDSVFFVFHKASDTHYFFVATR